MNLIKTKCSLNQPLFFYLTGSMLEYQSGGEHPFSQ